MATIGLVLSGGGARGIAHLGVLQALHELGIEADVISGVSAGAIMGAFYASGFQPKEILGIVENHHFFGLTNVLWRKSGFLNMKKVGDVYRSYFLDDSFDLLKKKLYITATDILTAEQVCFSSGSLSNAIIASSSIPVVFEPVNHEGHLLVDGGLLNNFPIEPLAKQCDLIIGVHVNPIHKELKKIHMKDIVDRSFHLALSNSVRTKSGQCDVFIEPPELYRFGMFDLSKSTEIFQIGYDHAMRFRNELLNLKNSIRTQ